MPLRTKQDDGGAKAEGISTKSWRAGCVPRAIAIATGRRFTDILSRCIEAHGDQKARHIGMTPAEIEEVLQPLGWDGYYVPCFLGLSVPDATVACNALLVDQNIHRAIYCTTSHCYAVVDGVVHDNYSRDGTTSKTDELVCVYTRSKSRLK